MTYASIFLRLPYHAATGESVALSRLSERNVAHPPQHRGTSWNEWTTQLSFGNCIRVKRKPGGGCGTRPTLCKLPAVDSYAAHIHYLPLLQIPSRFSFPASRFGLVSQHAVFGLFHHPLRQDTLFRMMKQNAVNQPGAKASRGVSQQFEFINLLNRPGLTDVGTKKAVRAHAMRDFRRRRGETYDNGRRKETSNIKNADRSKSSPTAQPSRNGVALEHPEWAYSTDAADESLPLKDAAYADEASHFFMPNLRNGDAFKSPFNFSSHNTFHGSILDNDGDEIDSLMSSERPRKRKKLHGYDASPDISGVDGDEWYSPLKLQGYHAGNEMMLVSPRLIKVPGAGSAEPFNALPVASTERVRILMHHCKLAKPLNMKFFFAVVLSSHVILVSSSEIYFFFFYL